MAQSAVTISVLDFLTGLGDDLFFYSLYAISAHIVLIQIKASMTDGEELLFGMDRLWT